MQGRGNSRGWLLDLTAGVALGAAVVLVTWIVSGGQPFGRIIGERDVSEPTTAATKPAAFERRAGSPARRAARLGVRAARPERLDRAAAREAEGRTRQAPRAEHGSEAASP